MNDREPTSGDAAPGSGTPSREDVLAALSRILSSADFAQSDRIKRFLAFVVEESLAGRAGLLKEYTIGLEVFDRDDSFDPQTSSIVRVEASRLRAKLEKYNATAGRDDPARITLPAGSYAPTFIAPGTPAGRDEIPASSGGKRRFSSNRVAIVALGAAILGGAGALLLLEFGGFDETADPVTEAAAGVATDSIAVLPLRNLSGEAGEDYFSDGMTDALITRLAMQGSVRVISLTSAMVYKDVNMPIADIARELGVSHVIEGSVLRVGNKVRITAQLIEAESDRHLWAESYERDFADVLALQDDVVGRIAESFSGSVTAQSDGGTRLAARIDPAAQEAYLKGLYFRNKMTADGFRKDIAYFEQAIDSEPGFAQAYAGIAMCYCLLGGHGFEIVRPSEGMPEAKRAIMTALALDEGLAEPHAFLGIVRLKYEWDWAGAEDAFKRSLALNPHYAQAHLSYSFFLEAMGRQDAAIPEAEAARTIDPLSLGINVNLGWQYLRGDRLADALRQFEATAEMNPDFWGVHWDMGHYFLRREDHGEAIAAFQRSIAAGGGHMLPIADLGYAYAVSGDPAAAREILDDLEARGEHAYVSPFNMATIHMGLGEVDETFVWLERAFEERSRSLAWLNVAWQYDGVRSDPRFKSLLRRVGLPA